VGSHQLEILSALDGLDSAVHAELAIDALGVGAKGADRDGELVCDLGACEAAGEQSEHLQFPLAEGFEQGGL
jgi:hypothetical protein